MNVASKIPVSCLAWAVGWSVFHVPSDVGAPARVPSSFEEASEIRRTGDSKPSKPAGREAASRADVDDWVKDLSAPRPETRRSAVKKLAELGTRESFGHVLKALADVDGQVADEAQLAAGAVVEPRLVGDLAACFSDPNGDAWVRLRAVEAAGRTPANVEAKRVWRCLQPATGELARTALWTLERQGLARRVDGDAVDVADKLAALAGRGSDAWVRGAAIFALRPFDAFRAHDAALEALAERDEALRCAALGVVSTFTEQENLTVSTRALEDESTAVRAAAIANLERLKSRPAVLALIARLEREERTRLRYEIQRFLREISGEDHGFDLAAWRAWASTLQGPWSTGGTRPATGPLGDTRVALAGLTLLSDRVTFLIDLSGSMWDTKRGERTRKEMVDEKLRACLEALPKSAKFNVIPYTRDPIPWEKRLVPATRENVARAAEWFERCHQRGPGNVYDTAVLATEDPEVDTLVILTDGVPTGGRRWNLDLMVDLLVERNRYRQVAYDSILVDAPKRNRALWAELAERTGGRSIAVEAFEDLKPAPRPPDPKGEAPRRSEVRASPGECPRVECRPQRRHHDAPPPRLPVLVVPARLDAGPRP